MSRLKIVVAIATAIALNVVFSLGCHKNGVTQGDIDSKTSGFQTTGQAGANGYRIVPNSQPANPCYVTYFPLKPSKNSFNNAWQSAASTPSSISHLSKGAVACRPNLP